ncbi:MAG TPA: hypothetical protein VKT53_11205 [Candidatus Acidoferrum sp.]|nr:hypothetical protein [Candidatus Acidoferrum sp.]
MLNLSVVTKTSRPSRTPHQLRQQGTSPASTVIGVAALFSEEAQIDIEAIAVIP